MSFGNLICCGVKEMSHIQAHFYSDDRRFVDPNGAEKCMIFFMSQWYYNFVERRRVGSRTYYVLVSPRQWHIPGAHVIFTDARERPYNYGWRLARYIRKHNLGDLCVSRRAKNRNYAHVPDPIHQIAVWVWTPNAEALATWAKDRIPDAYDPKKQGLQIPPVGYVSFGLPYPFNPNHA